MAIRMFYPGMNYKQVAVSMADTFDIPEPSKATIYEWVRDYTDKTVETLRQHQVSDATFEVLGSRVGDAGIVGVLVVSGYYHTLAHALQVLGVDCRKAPRRP